VFQNNLLKHFHGNYFQQFGGQIEYKNMGQVAIFEFEILQILYFHILIQRIFDTFLFESKDVLRFK
jgi:hypothetical protein